MNIKKIIQEEVDDLSWMDDITSEYHPHPMATIYFIPNLPITSDMVNTLFNYMGEFGMKHRENKTWLTQYRDTGVGLVYVTTNEEGVINGHQTNNNDKEWEMDNIVRSSGHRTEYIDGYTILPFDKPANEH